MSTDKLFVRRWDYEEPLRSGCGSLAGDHKPDSRECAAYRHEQVQAAIQQYERQVERLRRHRPGMVD